MFVKLSNAVINLHEIASVYRSSDSGNKNYYISIVWKNPKNDLKLTCTSKEDCDKLFDFICKKLEAEEVS